MKNADGKRKKKSGSGVRKMTDAGAKKKTRNAAGVTKMTDVGVRRRKKRSVAGVRKMTDVGVKRRKKKTVADGKRRRRRQRKSGADRRRKKPITEHQVPSPGIEDRGSAISNDSRWHLPQRPRTDARTYLCMGTAIAALLLLSACGGGGDDDSGETPVAEASANPNDCGQVGEINSPNEIANAV